MISSSCSEIGRREFLLGASTLAMAAAAPGLVAGEGSKTSATVVKRRLGNLNCSLTGAGLARFGRDGNFPYAERIIHAGLNAGINFYDAANVYGNTPDAKYNAEDFLGRALGKRRGQVYIATKLGFDTESGSPAMPPPFKGLRAEDVERELDRSLRRLRTDYIDLYQTHQPDPDVPIEETLGAMQKAIEQGKVRFVGVSNHNAAMLQADAAATSKLGIATPGFVSTQNGFNMMRRDPATQVMPVVEELDMGFIPHTPLSNGLLTGKYKRNVPPPPDSTFGELAPAVAARYLTPRYFDTIEGLTAWAADHGHSMLDLAFAWLASYPNIISIIGGLTKPEYAEQNVRATEWRLSSDQRAEVSQIVAGFGY